MTRRLFKFLFVILFWAPVVRAEGMAPVTFAPERSLRPQARVDLPIVAHWDHHPRGARWTRAAVVALRSHARSLPSSTPADIGDWCPAYPSADRPQREAFWVGLVSALAKHESTWRPTAVGGGGRWHGLLQILPGTARGYRCRARDGAALRDGSANLACGLRIMAVTVPRDGVVSRGMRGVAADWGPFHSTRKREDMRNWVRGQSYCTAPGRSPRPQARPVRP